MAKTKRKTRELLIVLSVRWPLDKDLTPGVVNDITEFINQHGSASEGLKRWFPISRPQVVNMEFPWDQEFDK